MSGHTRWILKFVQMKRLTQLVGLQDLKQALTDWREEVEVGAFPQATQGTRVGAQRRAEPEAGGGALARSSGSGLCVASEQCFHTLDQGLALNVPCPFSRADIVNGC